MARLNVGRYLLEPRFLLFLMLDERDPAVCFFTYPWPAGELPEQSAVLPLLLVRELDHLRRHQSGRVQWLEACQNPLQAFSVVSRRVPGGTNGRIAALMPTSDGQSMGTLDCSAVSFRTSALADQCCLEESHANLARDRSR
jgi:hypothetical protein